MKSDAKKVKSEFGYYDEANPKRNRPFSVELLTEVKATVVDDYHGLEFYAGMARLYEDAARLMEEQAQRPAAQRKHRRAKVEAYKKLVAAAEEHYADASAWAEKAAFMAKHLTRLTEVMERKKTRADADTWKAARPHDVVKLAQRTAAKAAEAEDTARRELTRYQRALAAALEAIDDTARAAEATEKQEAGNMARAFSRTHDGFKKEAGKFSAATHGPSAYLQGVASAKQRFKK